jgi:hypothetical protein
MSKFKVGDWIVNIKTEDQTAYRIIEINDNFYKIKEGINELGYNRNLDPDLRLATSEEIWDIMVNVYLQNVTGEDKNYVAAVVAKEIEVIAMNVKVEDKLKCNLFSRMQ